MAENEVDDLFKRPPYDPFVAEISAQLQHSEDPAERWLGAKLATYQIVGLKALGRDAPLEFLGVITTDPEFAAEQRLMVEANPNRAYSLRVPDAAKEWGEKFLRQILKEVRDRICAKQSTAIGRAVPQATAVSLAAWITTELGIGGVLAVGIATFVLIVVSSIKGAFCKMTTEEAIAAVRTPQRKPAAS